MAATGLLTPLQTRMIARACALALFLCAPPAFSQDDIMDALALADHAPDVVAQRGGLRLFVEADASKAWYGNDQPFQMSQRLSADLYFETSLNADLHFTVSDRLDQRWEDSRGGQNTVNTLREVFVTWHAASERILDIGRVNARFGVAKGFNPTDFFRAGALRSIVSSDPNSLRENRLGTVLVRGQTIWNGGSLTVLYSPKLRDRAHDGSFDPDFGATNNRNRWLLAASQSIFDGFAPQFLLYGGNGIEPQFGINATSLIGNATVVYAEWAVGRRSSLLADAIGVSDDLAFRPQLATGVTYTTSSKLSVTLEYLYSGASMDATGWKSLQGDSSRYQIFRNFVSGQQEMVTKSNWFAYSTVQDAFINHLDFTAMFRLNSADHSRMVWVELRKHYSRADIAVQCQHNSGEAGSEFGAMPQRRNIQLLATWFY